MSYSSRSPTRRSSCVIIRAILTKCLVAAAISTASAQEQLDESQTLLFVDNQHIQYYAGIERQLRPLDRHSQNPVIEGGDKPWERLVAYCSVHHDAANSRFQMWYQSYTGSHTDDKTLRCVVCYAESQDGIHWNKPELNMFPFGDVEKTNIVLLSNDGPSVHYGASVVVNDAETEPSKRYKMAYWDYVPQGDKYQQGLCIAFSADGIHWTKHSQNPVLATAKTPRKPLPIRKPGRQTDRNKGPMKTLAVSDVIDATYDPRIQKYVIHAKTWIDGPDGNVAWKRAVVRTESIDFIKWSRPQLVMWPDERDGAKSMVRLATASPRKLNDNQRETARGNQLHGGPAFYYDGLYFSLLQVLDMDVTGLMPSELAISRDGLDWKRPFRGTPFLPVDGGNQFDSGTIWSNATPIIRDDEIWFYYGSYVAWHVNHGQYDDKRFTGVGLATMPRDRFTGLKPVDRFGQVTLKPMNLGGIRGITINADAKAGVVRGELIDADGYRVDGFLAEQAEPITGDGLTHKLLWKNNESLQLPDGEYVLRLHLDNATVYAVTLNQ